ncbi:MAG: hypothetical protein S4CHLAM7_06010 [Chlamydiae bacterium]|nr:hypothetical protein [Chlamydiota bacterium]
MAYDDIHHQDYWADFFYGHEGEYSNYVYSKSGTTNGSLFKNSVVDMDVPTTWANTMRMQIELLAEALKDPLNQKFIFVSDTTIPFCSFEKIYQAFMYTPLSVFPFCKNPHLDPMRSGTFWHYHNFQPQKIFTPIPTELQYKNSQWVVLNRKHAQMMVEDEKVIRIFGNYICDNEHYPSTFLAIKGLLLDEVLNRQTTYDDWIATADPSSPFTFTDLKDEYQLKLAVRAIEGNLYSQIHMYYFGRKFSKDCDLTPLDPYLEYRKIPMNK